METGNLLGVVTGQQGTPIPGATVTLTGAGAYPQVQVQLTNAQGQLAFYGLSPATYSVKVELEGFTTVEYPKIVISANHNTHIETTLTLQSSGE